MPQLPSLPRRLLLVAAGAMALAAPIAACAAMASGPSEAPRLLPKAADDPEPGAGITSQKAIFSGGCFWGIQGVFQHTKGVINAVSGYEGGMGATAHYDMVSTGTTGHAESVEVTYDPHQISYGELVRIFFSVATDPTQLNQQFPDAGTQYRNVLWTFTPAQNQVASAYIDQIDATHSFKKPIVTAVNKAMTFYPAEDYHQDYATLNPNSAYIATYDLPKIAALKKFFPSEYNAVPVLVNN